MSEVMTEVGWVRAVVQGEMKGNGDRYARIRLARDTGYFMDFDDPEAWEKLHHTWVEIAFLEQLGTDGKLWRVVLDVTPAERPDE